MAVCTIQTTALAATPAATAAASGSTSVSQSTAAKTTAATTNTVLPCDVQTSADGTEIKKIYDVDKNTSPEKIPQTDFERGGFKYTFTDLLKIELPIQDKKVHTREGNVASGSDKAQDVLRCCQRARRSRQKTATPALLISDISTINNKGCRHREYFQSFACYPRISRSFGNGYGRYSKDYYRWRSYTEFR